MTYPKPTTPLPWHGCSPDMVAVRSVMGSQDTTYIVRAANAFPHLVAALDEARKEVESAMPDWCDEHEQEPCCCSWHDTLKTIYAALAIARGEVSP